jgi:hypothetical protein
MSRRRNLPPVRVLSTQEVRTMPKLGLALSVVLLGALLLARPAAAHWSVSIGVPLPVPVAPAPPYAYPGYYPGYYPYPYYPYAVPYPAYHAAPYVGFSYGLHRYGHPHYFGSRHYRPKARGYTFR